MPPKKKTAQELATVAKGTRGPKSKHDYDSARLDFIQGITQADESITMPNLKELAEIHKIPYDALRKTASKERWTERKNQFQVQQAQERQTKRAKELATQAVDFDKNAHSASKLGITLATTRLAEIAAEMKQKKDMRDDALERMARGESVERWETYSAINYRELEGLASALERFQSIGMKALGTDVQRHEINNPDGNLGTTVEFNVIEELGRDDPHRLATFLRTAMEVEQKTGVSLFNRDEEENIEDAELVEEEDEDDDEEQ